MAIGENKYRNATDLEPIAQAITFMGQDANKKDKPIILGQKIRAISTDATATPSQVLSGQTFYSGGKKQQGNVLIAGTAEAPVSISKQSNSDLSVFPPAKYFKGTTESGILLPIGALRGQGYALQTEVDTWRNNYNSKVTELSNMTTDRDNWKNIANSRIPVIKTICGNSFSFNMPLVDGSICTIRDLDSKIQLILQYVEQTGKYPKRLFRSGCVLGVVLHFADQIPSVVAGQDINFSMTASSTVYLLMSGKVSNDGTFITLTGNGSYYTCNFEIKLFNIK